MANNRLGGIISLKRNGVLLNAKGNFTFNPGFPKRETLMGANGVPQGFSEKGTPPMIEGELTDTSDLDIKDLFTAMGDTITLELNNGKVFCLRDAWFAGDGNIGTEEANIAVKFEGKSGEVIT